ncbi:MAG: system N-acetylglucosamine-specific enzyme component [Firmicutes bacterium]|nr:system N-acetylglucosamine-specific enzyme component [Bacillota bacterium]
MRGREAFFQRVAASLIIPVTVLPLAAILLAVGSQAGIHPLEAAGMALIRSWLPLVFGVAISIGFTDGDGMGALAAALGFLVMSTVAEAVAGDPSLNVGVLGGIIAGIACTWVYNRVKGVGLPEYLALFSGKRLAVLAAALAGIVLGYPFGFLWPSIREAIITFGAWVYGAGPAGAFIYGAVLRLLIPTGLHHILMQLVDAQLGGWIDPATGKLVAGEYYRFLAGDPQAGRLLSGFFLSLGFGNLGAALAIMHEARPELRRKVAGLMLTGILTGFVLGVTEPVEFAFIFASPLLWGLHVLFSGLASLVGYTLGIRMGGYALPMVLINWHLQQNAWLLLPLGLAFTALYYVSFRAVIRWLRPPILGQVAEAAPAEGKSGGAAPRKGQAEEGAAYLAALGGEANIVNLDACMTRLRLVVREPTALDDARLKHMGTTAILRPGGGEVQVVVGTRAGDIATGIRAAMGSGGTAAGATKPVRASTGAAGQGPAAASEPARAAAPAPRSVTLLSPVTGRVLPLDRVPDPVFAERLAGDGIAVEATAGVLLSPASGQIVHVFPTGHALGLITPDGLELLIHIGIDTVTLKGEGFQIAVREGDTVRAGEALGRFDPALITVRGKSLITPVLVTNQERIARLTPLASGQVRAGEPLLQIELTP